MREQTPALHEQPQGGSGLPGIFAESDEAAGLVTVTCGPYAEALPVSNTTVGDIRARFRDRLDIDARSEAVLDGNVVDDRAVVRAGQLLAFVHRGGEKGARR
jgi:hypothetical protein